MSTAVNTKEALQTLRLFGKKKQLISNGKKRWNNVLSWDFSKPEVKWFEGGQLNITENCLDRHLSARGEQTAIKWIANDPNEQSKCLSYKELHLAVCQFANVLKNNGAKKEIEFVCTCLWCQNLQ